MTETDLSIEEIQIPTCSCTKAEFKIGKDCSLGSNVNIDTGVEIGDNVTIQDSVSVSRLTLIENNIFIGKNTQIFPFSHIRAKVSIGEDCHLGPYVYLDERVKIGNRAKINNFVSIYHGVTIEEDVVVDSSVAFTNDLYPRAFIWGEEYVVSTLVRKGARIGANATLICGITVGEYAMICPGSVVVEHVQPNTIVFGNPAKPIGSICQCGRRVPDLIWKDASRTNYRCEKCGHQVMIGRIHR